MSALNLLIGTDATTPVIRALVRDVAIENANPNREAWREICRNRAKVLLDRNQNKQDSHTNRQRHPPKVFKTDDLVFVIKYSQSTGKLDSGMRGPYRVIKVLPSNRYELKLLGGARGKTTQAAAQYMVPWKGEWCPESCTAFFENTDDEGYDGDEAGPSSVAPAASMSDNVDDVPEDGAQSGEAVLG